MMRQMREATKPIMLFTAIAFVALMVFQWGMDITGRGSGGYGQIGSVNGDPVMYDAYMAAYRRLYDQVQRSQEGMISSQQNSEIEDAAFDEVVNQLLIQQELDKRGITVSDSEISDAARFSPPEYLRQQFVDSAGRFSLPAYQTFLASLPPEQLLMLEADYRAAIPRGKLLRQVTSGIYVSDAALWQQWKDQNEQVEIRYVSLDPATRYEDADFPVPEQSVQDYYDAHQDEFEVPARATVRAVVIDQTPTAADTAASLEHAREVRQEIIDGADFAEVARRESADQNSAAVGGELGVVAKGLLTPAFDSAAFAAPLDQLTQPVKSPFGYHLIEVTDRWAADSVAARHILIPIERTDDSEIGLLTLADSLEELSTTMSLAEAAEAVGLTASTVDITATFPFVTGAGQISEGADWVFEDEPAPGDVSPVFETPQAFYALELVSAEPEGVLPLDEVRPSIESTLRFEQKLSRARVEGGEVVAAVRAGQPLDSAAAAADLEVETAGPFSRFDFVSGIGRQNAAIGAAFGLEPGVVSDVITTADNAFILEVTNHLPADSTEWSGQMAQQRQGMVTLLEQQRLQVWLDALREAADINDRRDEVLQPVDEDAPPMQQMPLGF